MARYVERRFALAHQALMLPNLASRGTIALQITPDADLYVRIVHKGGKLPTQALKWGLSEYLVRATSLGQVESQFGHLSGS